MGEENTIKRGNGSGAEFFKKCVASGNVKSPESIELWNYEPVFNEDGDYIQEKKLDSKREGRKFELNRERLMVLASMDDGFECPLCPNPEFDIKSRIHKDELDFIKKIVNFIVENNGMKLVNVVGDNAGVTLKIEPKSFDATKDNENHWLSYNALAFDKKEDFDQHMKDVHGTEYDTKDIAEDEWTDELVNKVTFKMSDEERAKQMELREQRRADYFKKIGM